VLVFSIDRDCFYSVFRGQADSGQ